MAKGTVTVNIIGDTDRLRSSLNDANGLLGNFESKVSSVGSRLKGFGSAVVGGIFGGGLIAGISSLQTAIQGVANEYSESVKVGAETERVIRTTGGAAGVTAKQVERLSTALSEKTGVDDETIQSSANLLLTFTNVRNELGKGNDVFSQAVKLSGDMATSLGTDSRTAAMQLGKALNDPVKGVTALTRAGVSFTQQQKDQIRWAMFFGDKLAAQKVILGEVSKEFGGAAEAAATPIDKLKVKWANFQESLGKFAVEDALPWLQEMWPKVEQIWNDGVAKVRQIVEPFLRIVEILWARFGDNILNFLKGLWAAIRTIFEGAFNVIKGIVDFFLAIIQGDWGAAWDALGEILSGAWQMIVGIIEQAWNQIKFVFGVAWETLTAIFGALWDGLKSLVAGAWNEIVGFVMGGVNGIVNAIASAPGAILGLIGDFINAGMQLGSSVVNGIRDGISAVAGFAGDVAGAILDAFKRGWNSVANTINDFIPNEVGFDTPFGFVGVDLPDNPIPRFHSGGIVPGSPGEEVLAILQAGERVIPANGAGIPRISAGMSAVGGAGASVYVTVQGSVITEKQLVDAIHEGLLRKQRAGSLGLNR